MRAVSVPLSAVLALGTRLDVQPYMEATETPDALRARMRKAARSAYWRAARRGVAQIRNTAKFRRAYDLDKIEVLA